jgi:hypothetical protein
MCSGLLTAAVTSRLPPQAVDLALARLQRGADSGLDEPTRRLPGAPLLADSDDALEPALQHLRSAIMELWKP